MDNEEDDDGNFTKWMSSYWGHGEEHNKERKRSFRRPSRNRVDRRASLPCMSQLEAMQLNHLHANNMAPAHLKSREEKEVRSHPHARRVSSDENSRTKAGGPECHITTIPELSECLEKRLRFHNQKNYGMEGVASKSFTAAIILIKRLGRQNGQSSVHVHVVGVLHLRVNEGRRHRSALDKRNIACPVVNCLYADSVDCFQ
ncbi:unnamed protein product [Leuciscus chuanchicus]